MDAVFILAEDEFMTGAAGLGLLGHEVGFTHPLDVVHPVTVRADGGVADEPFFEQGFPVDALHIFLIRSFAVDVVLDYDRHVLMTGGAGERDVPAVDRGFRVCGRMDVVLAVAVPALGHFLGATLDIGASMDAVGVEKRVEAGAELLVFTVAGGGAVRGRDILLMRDVSRCPVLLNGMAVSAAESAMDRGREMIFVDLEPVLERPGFSMAGKTAGVLAGSGLLAVEIRPS
jgi:hypothetical protein